MAKILSIKDFKSLKSKGVGYVLITDKPSFTQTLHRADYPHVDQSNFYQKVI